MKRHSTEWLAALDAYVGEHAEKPFAWGPHDCCTWAAGWVQQVRGADPMADLRGYDSALSAGRVLASAGGLLAAVTARMGSPITGTMAQIGDVALVRHGQGLLSMGICIGPYIAAPGQSGLLMVSIARAEAAWRV